MRNLKRALSLTLASVMLLGMMVVGAGAASFPDVDDNDNVEAIEVLKATGVMIGDNGNFKPDAPVTRNEMAVIMTNMLGLNANDFAGACPFTDVQAWAQNYVAACYANGIIAGRSATVFDGQATVTATEAAAMMMRALGYFKYPGDYEGGFTAATVRQAATLRLFNGISANANAPMVRNDVAQLALNTLEADVVDFAGSLGFEFNGITQGYVSKYEPRKDLNNVNNQGYNYTGDSTTTHQKEYLQLLESLYDGKLTKNSDADDYGMPATTWVYDGKDVVTTAKAAEYTWTTGIEDITLDDLYKALGDKTGNLIVYENGTPLGTSGGTASAPTFTPSVNITPTKGATASGDKKLAAYKGATIYAVDKFDNSTKGSTLSGSPDGIVDSLIVVYPYLAKVTKVTEATDKAERKITMDVWSGRTTDTKITGVTYETNNFQKDDFVLVYPDGSLAETAKGTMTANQMSNKILDVKAADVVTGKVTTVKKDSSNDVKSLLINDTTYTVGGDPLATNGNADNTMVKKSSFGFRSEYTLYLSNGYIMGSEGTNSAKDIDNIVYVTVESYQPVGEYGTSNSWYTQVIRMDGTVEVLKTASANKVTGVTNDNGAFYVIADSNNDGEYEFTAASAYSSIDNNNVYYGTDTTSAAVTMKADDKTLAVTGATKAYLSSSSRILFVKDSKEDLKTSMVTGPIRQNIAASETVLLSQDDDGNYVVEAIVIKAEKANASDDVVYVVGGKVEGEQDGNNLYKIYNAKTGESSTVPAKAGDVVTGFATYSVNDNGLYKFTAVTTVSDSSPKNSDGSYAINENITKRGNLLNKANNDPAGSGQLEDIDAADAVIINNTGSSDNDNLTLSDVAGADALTAVAYVVDEKVIAIVVNSYTETVLSSAADITAFTVTFTKNASNGDAVIASVSAAKDAGTATNINATFGAITTGSLKDGDKIDVTAGTVSTGASVSPTAGEDKITFTWDGAQWNGTGKIVVIPASGEDDKVTYNPGTCKSSDARLSASATSTSVTGITEGSNGAATITVTVAETGGTGENGKITIAVDAKSGTADSTTVNVGFTLAAQYSAARIDSETANNTKSFTGTITVADGTSSITSVTVKAEDGTTTKTYDVVGDYTA